jgi:UDP-N-acetyl-2-amino-2-deoxyglucuronate dehydrogenase
MSFQIGIVGIGMIADFQARAIQETGRAEVVACCSRSMEKAQAFGARHNCRPYDTVSDFLSHPGLQIVSVCTPSGAHLDVSVAAAEAGKHLIVEKPLEVSSARCDRIIEVCARHHVLLAGIFPSRFNDVSRVVKEAVSQGRLGRPSLGSAYVKWFRSQEYYAQGRWQGASALGGGGALMTQAIHAVDLLQWFMGPVDSVTAFTATVGHPRIEVEDDAVAALRFKNGALGAIEASTAAYPGSLKRIELSGTEGSIVLEEESLLTWSFARALPDDAGIRERFSAKATSGGGASDPAAIGIQGHQRQFEDFLDALEAGRSPDVDGAEARKSVRIIEAIYESARESRSVFLA